jgi:hypothetical protein
MEKGASRVCHRRARGGCEVKLALWGDEEAEPLKQRKPEKQSFLEKEVKRKKRDRLTSRETIKDL